MDYKEGLQREGLQRGRYFFSLFDVSGQPAQSVFFPLVVPSDASMDARASTEVFGTAESAAQQ